MRRRGGQGPDGAQLPGEPKAIRARATFVALAVTALMGAAPLLVFLPAAASGAVARSSASEAHLAVEADRAERPFALGTVGLSTEVDELSTDHFSVDHYRLVRLMSLLGPSVLRIGGHSADVTWWTSTGERPPAWATDTITPADLEALHGLLVSTGWHVILATNLGHFEPARAADEAHAAQQLLGAALIGIELGNEPDNYRNVGLRPPSYSSAEYLREAAAYAQAIGSVAPGVSIYGPSLSPTSSWLTQTEPAAGLFAQITQHYYPTSTCAGTPDSWPAPTPIGVLSRTARQNEDELLGMLGQVGTAVGHAIRLSETNAVSACQGAPASEPSFATALWALDWSLRAARAGVAGLNFHGRLGLCDASIASPVCAESKQAASAGELTAQPEYYGLLAARQLEGGWFVPAVLTGLEASASLDAWATRFSNGTVKIALDNLATDGAGQPVSINASGFRAVSESLSGASIEAKGDIAFGGASVTADGKWPARPAKLRRTHGILRVLVPAASADVITLSPRVRHHAAAR